MKRTMLKRASLFIAALATLLWQPSRLLAQSPGNPMAVPVKMWGLGGGIITGTNGTPSMSLQLAGVIPSADLPSGVETLSTSGFGSAETSTALGTAEVIPNKVYTVDFTVAYAYASFYFVPAPGYTMLINGQPQRCFGSITAYQTTVNDFVTLEVVPVDPFSGTAGVSSQIKSGMVGWEVSLGGLLNGNTAGNISICDVGTESSWSTLFTPGALQYSAPSSEIIPYNNPSTGFLRQVLGDQADVDIETVNSTTYTVSFYNPAQLTGSGFPFSFNGQPFVQYTITQGASSNSLQITSTTYETTSSNYTSVPVARTAVTSLTRVGNGVNNFQWTMNAWNTSGQSQVSQEDRTWAGTAGARTEELIVPSAGGSEVLSVSKSYTTFNWGEELTASQVGNSAPNPIISNFAYYSSGNNASNPGSYGFFESSTSSDGSWTLYDYYFGNGGSGLLPITTGTINHIYRPFLSAPSTPSNNAGSGEVTTLSWSLDPFGAPTRLASSVTQINNVTTSNVSNSYTDAYTSLSIYCPLYRTNETDYITRATTTTAFNAAGSLTSYTEFFAENSADSFYAGQPYLSLTPNSVQTDYAYQRGDFNPSTYTFTADPTAGISSSVAVITGSSNSAAGTPYGNYNGFTVATIYLVDKESTLAVTIRDSLGLVRLQQNFVWLAATSSWQLIGQSKFAYDYAGNLSQKTDLNGAVTTNVFNGQQLASSTDPTGVVKQFSYDAAGRIAAVAKVGGATSNISYDNANHVLSKWISATGTSETITSSYQYDDAGRVTSQVSPGMAAQTISYTFSPNGAAGSEQLITNADGGTIQEIYSPDGRLSSRIGTAVVPAYYTYALDPTNAGFLDTTVSYGSAGSNRWVEIVTDLAGRTFQNTIPDYNTGYSLVTQNNFDPVTGNLNSVVKPGQANTLYGYDYLGVLNEECLDVNNLGSLTNAAISKDRIKLYNNYVYAGSNGYWMRRDTTIYPTLNSANTLLVSSVLKRLTGFATNQLSETQTTPEYQSDTIDESITVNAASQTVTDTTSVPGAANNATTIVVNGRETQTTGIDGLSNTYGYDALERPNAQTDSRGKTTTTTYVPGTTLAYTVADPTSTEATYGYDNMGRQNSVTDAQGNETTTTYTPIGKIKSIGGTGNYAIGYSYDAYGAPRSMTTSQSTQGALQTTSWNYDSYTGLLTSKTDNAGRGPTYTYNSNNQLVTRTWARGVTTTYSFDPATGQLTSKSYSDGTPTVQYSMYSRTGIPLQIMDATGTRNFTLDTTYADRVDSEWLDNSGTVYSGQVVTSLFETTTSVSSTLNYNNTYATGTMQGRPSGIEIGTSINPALYVNQQYVHSTLGQLVGVATSNGGGTTRDFTYSYLANTEFVSGYTATNSNNFSVTCQMDPVRPLVTSVQGSTGGSVVTEFDYTYNTKNQRLTTTQKGSAYADYFSGASYTNVYNKYIYDSFGELTSATMYTGGNTPIPGRVFQYQYDQIGNRTYAGETGTQDDNQVVANSLNEYQSIENQMTRVLGNTNIGVNASVSGAKTAQLDRNFAADYFPSNTSQPVYSSVSVSAGGSNATNNFLIQALTQTPTYDADGNLTNDSVSGSTNNGAWTYSYDGENRLQSVISNLTGSGYANYTALKLTFVYDYLGRRVRKWVQNAGGTSTILDHRFIYSGNKLLAETDSTGKVVRSYSWGPGGSNSTGSLIELTNFAYNGSSISTTDYFPTSDGNGNGNVASLVRSYDGNVSAVYEYGPFGETLRRESPTSDTSVSDNSFRFASNYTDAETGLIYYGHRYYSPGLGRFINRDPIGEAGGVNLYGFCGNDPINRFDVNGCSWLSKFWDRTFLSFGKHVAQNWDHGRQYVIDAAAVVVAIVTYGYASEWAAAEIADSAYSAEIAASGNAFIADAAAADAAASASTGIISGAVGGAAAGATSAATSVALSGGNLSQVGDAALRGAGAGAIMGGVGGIYGNSWDLGRVGLTAIAGGTGSVIEGGAFQHGFELNGAIALLTDVAYNMRLAEVENSKLDPANASGSSKGFFGDAFKLGGGRFDLSSMNPEAELPFGGFQGGDGKLFGRPYLWGGFTDNVVEAFAGPHDWLGSWWSYNRFGDNDYLNSPFGSILNNLFGKGTANFMNQAMGGVDIPLAAPFAVASEIGTNPGSSTALTIRK